LKSFFRPAASRVLLSRLDPLTKYHIGIDKENLRVVIGLNLLDKIWLTERGVVAPSHAD
jgi:hypothetical protein